MSNYEKMVAETRLAKKNRIAVMLRAGKTVEEAKAILKAESDRHFAVASARSRCGITNRPATIGEILLAKARG